MRRAGGCAIALVVAFGSACGGGAGGRGQAVPTDVSSAALPPPLVTVDVLGATIAPGKTDGRQWDGLSGEPSRAVLEANAALGLAIMSYGVVLAALTDLANTGFTPPDVAGLATLFMGGVPTGSQWELPTVQDSYAPSWSAVRWVHVPLDDRVRIRLSLTDEDISEDDDPIGQVELNASHLRAALANQRGTQVRVSDQHPQVLFVEVSVMRE